MNTLKKIVFLCCGIEFLGELPADQHRKAAANFKKKTSKPNDTGSAISPYLLMAESGVIEGKKRCSLK